MTNRQQRRADTGLYRRQIAAKVLDFGRHGWREARLGKEMIEGAPHVVRRSREDQGYACDLGERQLGDVPLGFIRVQQKRTLPKKLNADEAWQWPLFEHDCQVQS